MISRKVTSLALSLALFTASSAFASADAKGGHDMNALFPQPKPNTALAQRPEKPELEAPAYYEKIADAKVVLKWKEAAGSTAYHVQVATDPNFKWLVKEEPLLKGTSLEVGGLEGGKSYFWRVAGVKPENKNGHIQGVYNTSMFETVAK